VHFYTAAYKNVISRSPCSVTVEQALSLADWNCSPLLCAGSRAARAKVAVSGIANRMNYRAIATVHTQFTLVAAGRVTRTGGPWVAYP